MSAFSKGLSKIPRRQSSKKITKSMCLLGVTYSSIFSLFLHIHIQAFTRTARVNFPTNFLLWFVGKQVNYKYRQAGNRVQQINHAKNVNIILTTKRINQGQIIKEKEWILSTKTITSRQFRQSNKYQNIYGGNKPTNSNNNRRVWRCF